MNKEKDVAFHSFKMKIFVRRVSPGDATITLSDVDDSTRIIDVKRMVQGKWEVDPECQRLIFAGRQLHDSQTVADCKITDECVLQLVEGLRRPTAKIFVKTLTGKTIEVDDVDHNTTVLEVKHKIHSAEGIDIECQRLIYAGHQLVDSETLEKYNIRGGATLHLVLRLRPRKTHHPTKTILAKTLMGQTIPVDVNRCTTVLHVKRKLRLTVGVVPEDQSLIYGRELTDSETLEGSEIHDMSVLHLVIRTASVGIYRDEIPVPQNMIRVVASMGQSIAFWYEGSATRLDVKRKIRPLLDDDSGHHELFFNGHEMINDDALEQCGIGGGSTLYLILRSEESVDTDNKVLIKVKWNGDDFFQKWVAKSMLVGDIKELIGSITELGGERQRLLCSSGVLEDDSLSIGHYASEDCASVELELHTKESEETGATKINVTLPNKDALVIDRVATSASVGSLKMQICSMKDIKPEEHRLVYRGSHLAGEDYSLAHFGIGDNSDVQLLPNIKKSDALEEYLMMSAEERENAVEPIKALRRKARSEGASDFFTYKFVKLPDILHESQRTILCELLDFMWHNTAIDGAARTDMFLPISADQLVAIVSSLDIGLDDKYKASKLIEKLKTRFYSVPGSESSTFKVLLCMTKGPCPCDDFECLGTDARSTSEVLLNSPDDYNGGEVAFFVNDEVDILPRTAGSLVQYPPKVLRGITSVVEGTRMSLLILDKDDVRGDNDTDPRHTLTGDDVVSFLAHRANGKC